MDSPRKDKIVTKTSGASLLLDLHQISKIFAWGEGKEGTLGHGESTNSTSPMLIGGFDNINFTSVSAGLYHSVAISVDGKLYSWGRGENGRLGHGDVLTRFRPKAIEFQQADSEVVPIDGTKFRVVSAGYHHNVAIDSEGNLYSWGSGWSGQLGHNTTDDIKRPMLILNSSAARSTSSNAVVGNKTVLSRSSALQISEPDKRRSLKESLKNDAETRFATAAAGFHHSLAITESGKLYSWGFGEHGQLGHGEKKRVSKPRIISASKDIIFKQVSASEYHSLALSTDGKIYAWGWGEFGELGLGQDNKQVSVPTPVLVRGNARAFKAVAAGAYLSVALCNDGHLYTAGRQLRERSPFNYEFTKMEGAGHLRFVQVSAKNNHVLLLSEDSTIYSWGHNTVGQLGYEGEGDLIPRPVSSPHFSAPGVAVLQVSAGGNHSLALAKVPFELSNNISQSQGSPSLSSSTSQVTTPVSASKSAPSSPATPQSRVRSQQLVLAMLESSTEANQSKSRDRSYTVEVSSPRSGDTDLESSGTKKDKEKREKKRSKSKLEDSGSRTSRPRLEESSSKKSSKQHSKGEIMSNTEIQNKINDLMAKQHEALKAEQKLLKQKEEILKKETKLKQDMSDIETSLKMYLSMLMGKLNTSSNSSGSRVSIGPISEKL